MIRKTLTILSLIDLLLVVLSGCSARRIYVSGDRGIHPCVKWVFRSGDQSAYFLWIVMLEQEDFDDAALFGDRLVLCSWGGGEFARSNFDHINVIDPNDGTLCYSITNLVRTYARDFYVADGKFVLQNPVDEKHRRAYDLTMGRSVPVPEGEARKPSELKEVYFRLGPDPREPGPINLATHTTMAQLSPTIRLIQKCHPDSGRYGLYLEHELSATGERRRIRLAHLDRHYASPTAWMGRDNSGDYVIVLFNGFAIGLDQSLIAEKDASSEATDE